MPLALRKVAAIAVFAVLGLALTASRAAAVPILQLYVEGATYDAASESWNVALDGSALRLWAIGNVGSAGTIHNVRLAISYAAADGTPALTLTPGTTGGLGGFLDPSTPGAVPWLQTVTDGSSPTLGDGKTLPSHGVYGAGVHWQEFGLGNFTATDSPIADFIDAFPAPTGHTGQINVYEIAVTGPFTGSLHFDLYDTYYSKTKAKATFAPFSHDAEGCCGDNITVPEPGTFSMVGWSVAALSGALGIRRRRPAR